VHDLLVSLEASALGAWVRESGSLWAYPTILTLHTVGMSLLVGASLVLDLRMLGVAPALPVAPLALLFRAVWAGAAVSVGSGLLLFAADATTKGTTTVFFVKLGCIAAGLGAAALLRPVVAAATDDRIPARARLLAAASLLAWAGAITAGRFMAYLTPGPVPS
jgi:hypothetical protein